MVRSNRMIANKGFFSLLCDTKMICKVFRAIFLMLSLFAMTAFSQEGGNGEKVIAEGDGFSLTLKQFNGYRSAIAPDDKPYDKKELLAAIFRYELLSREYFNKQKETGVEPTPEASRTIEIKVHAAKKYTQEILDNYVLSDDVITSYYRSYPEKFRTGNATGTVAGLLPLDDGLKNEIRFIIVEKKKNTIIAEMVQNLILKYNIKIIE